jgi:predicted RNase H-like nuclease (RuvC/YqgF family)
LERAQSAKVSSTQAMMKNLVPIGRALSNYQNIVKSIASIRTEISKLQPLVMEMRIISKLCTSYKDYISEIKRRKGFDEKSKRMLQSFQKQVQSMLQTEVTKRKAFHELNGSTNYLKPLALLLSKPPLSLSVTSTGEELPFPDLGELPVALEDEFCFVEEGTPEERLKKLERENGELVETLHNVLHELTSAKSTIEDQSKQLSSLNSIVSSKSLKEATPKKREDNDLEVKSLKENNAKLSQDLQTLQKRNQLLLSEIDQSSQKIKELEQRISDVESLNPDIKKLQDMGFSLDLARKAIKETKTIDEALQWILESSRV